MRNKIKLLMLVAIFGVISISASDTDLSPEKLEEIAQALESDLQPEERAIVEALATEIQNANPEIVPDENNQSIWSRIKKNAIDAKNKVTSFVKGHKVAIGATATGIAALILAKYMYDKERGKITLPSIPTEIRGPKKNSVLSVIYPEVYKSIDEDTKRLKERKEIKEGDYRSDYTTALDELIRQFKKIRDELTTISTSDQNAQDRLYGVEQSLKYLDYSLRDAMTDAALTGDTNQARDIAYIDRLTSWGLKDTLLMKKQELEGIRDKDSTTYRQV